MDKIESLPFIFQIPFMLLGTVLFAVAWPFTWGGVREKVSRFYNGEGDEW
jgi:hypothetical protein